VLRTEESDGAAESVGAAIAELITSNVVISRQLVDFDRF